MTSTWVRTESSFGAAELRQNGSAWQLLTKPTGESTFQLSATGDFSGAASTSILPAPDEATTIGTLRLDRASGQVTLDGAFVHLSPLEYHALCTLMEDPKKIIPTTHLVGDGNRQVISRLRNKLDGKFIFNYSRRGYSLIRP